MKKRFLVAAEMSREAEKEFIAYLRENKLGWWHRIANFWLITDNSKSKTTHEIRDQLQSLRAVSPYLVMEMSEDIDWAGIHPTATPDTFHWLKKTWLDQ